MIAITNADGLTLQLAPDQTLVTELAVAWLSDDELPSERSFPIEAPLTDNNKKFVGHGYRPDRAGNQTTLPVKLEMAGVLYKNCTYAYRVQGGKLSGYLKIDSAEFYDKIRRMSLLEALPDIVRIGDGLVDGYTNATVALAQRMKAIAGMSPGGFPLTFFPIRNEAMLEDSYTEEKLTGYLKRNYVNNWEGGNFKTDGTVTAAGYLVAPQFFLWWVLQKLMALAGYRIESDWLAQEEIQRLVIVNMTAMPVTQLGLGNASQVLGGHSITAGMYLPDMSVSDFLKAVKGRWGLVFQFYANERVCRIAQFTRTLAAGSALDLTQYQVGDYDTDNADQKGFTVSEYIDSADELYKTDNGDTITPVAMVIGKGEQPVSLRAGTCQLILTGVPGSQTQSWFVPTVRQAGNVLDFMYRDSDNYPDKKGNRKNGIGLKFLTYRGLVASPSGFYPLATPDVRDALQAVVGSQSLNLAGRYGAWRQYLRAYYHFRDQTQKVSQPLLLPVTVLAKLPLHRLVQLSLEDGIRRSYLIQKVQAEQPGPSGLCTVRMDVLTIPAGLELSPAVEEPLVWLEFVLITNFDGNVMQVGTIGVKAWKDAARSQPASVTNLPVVIRTKKLWLSSLDVDHPLGYSEYQTIYYASGTGQIALDDHYIGGKKDDSSSATQYYSFGPSLDPGEGYNILQ